MRASTAVACLCSVLVPSWGGAADLKLGVDLALEYDDNVFSTIENTRDDLIGRIGPRLVATDETGDLRWDVRYSPRYQKYLDLEALDGWDQDFGGSLTWLATPRTTVSLRERYLDYENFSQVFTQDLRPDGTFDTGVSFGRQRFKQNVASFGLQHLLEARHAIALNVSRYDSEFESVVGGSSESEATTVGGSYVYTLSHVDHIGLSLAATRQTVAQPDELNTDYYNVSGLWTHLFGRTITLSVSAGPAWVRQDAREPRRVLEDVLLVPLAADPDGVGRPIQVDTCPRLDDGAPFVGVGCEPFPSSVVFLPDSRFGQRTDLAFQGDPPGETTNLTYFADVSLSKRWQNVQLILAYTRSASTAAEVSGVVRDNFSINVHWTPARRWGVTLNTYYETREQAAGGNTVVQVLGSSTIGGVPGVAEAVAFRTVEIENDISVDAYLASVYATYIVSERMQIYFGATWTSERTSAGRFGSKLDRMTGGVGVIYWLPTLQLPI